MYVGLGIATGSGAGAGAGTGAGAATGAGATTGLPKPSQVADAGIFMQEILVPN